MLNINKLKHTKLIYFILILSIIEISLALYLTFWREHFWDALVAKNYTDFLKQLGIFTVVATSAGLISGYSGYLVALAGIEWRQDLTAVASKLSVQHITNINQRIQEDCWIYPDLMLNLFFGLIKSIIYLLVFTIFLLLSFSYGLLIQLLIFAVLGTWIVHHIAKPLVELNYTQQTVEATYRTNLTPSNFTECIKIMLGLATKTKHLSYVQSIYNQIGVVIPIIIISPIYFSTSLTVGTLMRFNSMSSTILDSLSYGITNYGGLNKLRSCHRRLKEAGII